MVEVAISLSVLALMALVVERTLATTHEAERYLGALRRVTERGQKVAFDVHGLVGSSRKIYARDALGTGYLDALDLSRAPRVGTSRLPLPDAVGDMGPDVPGDPRTGSVLLFVRESAPVAAVANAAAGALRSIDVYRFVCVYPSQTHRRVVSDDPLGALDLVVWTSVAFPSRAQVAAIEDDAERQSVVTDLCTRFGLDFAWDANAPASAAFYEMDPLGTLSATPEPSFAIDEDPAVSDGGRLVYANVQLARTDPSSAHRRAVFTVDPPGTWVPDGFEVKVAGASGSRKVWMHLVVEAQSTRGREAVHQSTLIASTRDL
jgi:hypothetical protein